MVDFHGGKLANASSGLKRAVEEYYLNPNQLQILEIAPDAFKDIRPKRPQLNFRRGIDPRVLELLRRSIPIPGCNSDTRHDLRCNPAFRARAHVIRATARMTQRDIVNAVRAALKAGKRKIEVRVPLRIYNKVAPKIFKLQFDYNQMLMRRGVRKFSNSITVKPILPRR